MTVQDTVKYALLRYPTLYLKSNYEESAFSVMHHDFCVLGNGVDWATDKNGKYLGYLATSESKKVKGEWKKIPHPPYGKIKVTEDISFLFGGETLYEALVINHERYARFSKFYTQDKDSLLFISLDLPSEEQDYFRVYSESSVKNFPFFADSIVMGKDTYKKTAKYAFRPIERIEARCNPYPCFKEEYSPIWKKGFASAKRDWAEAAKIQMEHWKDYFNSSELCKEYSHNPSCSTFRKDEFFRNIQERYKGDAQRFSKEYELSEIFDITTEEGFDKMLAFRWSQERKRIQDFIDKTLLRIYAQLS